MESEMLTSALLMLNTGRFHHLACDARSEYLLTFTHTRARACVHIHTVFHIRIQEHINTCIETHADRTQDIGAYFV